MCIKVEKLRIVNYPAPVLRSKAQDLEGVTDEVRRVGERMLELMHEAPGVGLAAPQVGLGWRMFVANPTGEEEDDRVFVNPVLRDPSRETEEREEGCLSLPHVGGVIRRPSSIVIEALGLDGERFELKGEGLEARVWQHEYDHLEGVLIIDRMAEIDRLANKKVLRELEEDYKG